MRVVGVGLSGLTSDTAASIEKFRRAPMPTRQQVVSTRSRNNSERLLV